MAQDMIQELIAARPKSAVVRKLSPSSFKLGAGRRKFFEYRDDLNIGELTGSRFAMNWVRSRNNNDLTDATEWHYHVCEMQIGVYLKGFIDILFEDGRQMRVSAGDVIFIPPGFKHNEIRKSWDLEAIEIIIPGRIETVNCETPAPFVGKDHDVLRREIEEAERATATA